MGRRSKKRSRTGIGDVQKSVPETSGWRSERGEPSESIEPGREAEVSNAVPGPASSRSNRRTGRFRGWRGWVLRVTLLILSPILFVSLLEAGLRLGGYGYPTGFFVEADVGGTYKTNDQFGWRFFPRSLTRYARPCVLTQKPADSVRIFVLGGSAAMGFPDPAYSFGRILAAMLREQYPDTRFEIVNGAMTAINSHVTLEIARDCAAHEPDLFVVYLGNNEVVGPFGPGTVFQQWTPSLRLVRTSLWARSLRVGQLFGDVAGYFGRREGMPDRWLGMEMFLDNPVPADDLRLTAVYDNFQQNLIDICGLARRVDAAVVLSTVAVNLRDCPPFASRHRSDLTPQELTRWQSTYEAGGELAANERWQEAIDKFEAAARIDDGFAELHFRIGHCLLKLSRDAEARDRFVLARDLDIWRFRADSRINRIVRKTATEQAIAGVVLVDTELAFSEHDQASTHIPGDELFYEHVHLTFAGNYLLARSVLEQVRTALPQLAAGDARGEVPSSQRCAELLAFSAWAESSVAEKIVNFTARPPFTNQWNHADRQAAARARSDELRTLASTPQSVETAWTMCETAIAKAPDDWSLHEQFSVLATQFGRPDVAVEQLRMAIKEMPYRASLHTNLGAALDAQGKASEAIDHYQMALEIDPDEAMAHFNLANTLARLGQVDDAESHYRMALEIQPDDAMALCGLGALAAACGRTEEAITHYQLAVEAQPDNAIAHFGLGGLLSGRGMGDEAIDHYQKAVEINPREPNARRILEAARSARDSAVSAIAECRELLRLNPRDVSLLNDTAWLLATAPYASLRNGSEALTLAQRAIALPDGESPEILTTLAAAFAETGQFADAVQTANQAAELASQQNKRDLAENIQVMIQYYEAETLVRELPPQ